MNSLLHSNSAIEPLVSILIPCYNAEKWLKQAITSALDQTYQNIEIIVIDDGSTDRSLEIIQSFGKQIRWEAQKNSGGNATRNRLLELSRGSWLQYLDADDYLLPDKIARQVEFVEFMGQSSDTSIIYSPSILQHHYSQTVSIEKKILPIPAPRDPWILLARWYLPQTGSSLWRKKAVVDVGGWREDLPCCQEHELYLRLLQAGKKFSYFAQSGSVYRQWSESTVCNKDRSKTYRQRLEITDRLEKYLLQSDRLTKLRQTQINQARFECARIIWQTDRSWANKTIAKIKNTQPEFIPLANCVPVVYCLIYRYFGFETAETVATIKRQFKISPSLKLSRV